MREHPIPQDITGYQFHIIGNMTIKQFAEVATGAFIGFLIYSTNLPEIIKWPFILLFAAAGAVAAFVPIMERPLDHWVVTFFRILYKPTKFYWRKTPKIPDPFLFKPENESVLLPELDLTPIRRTRVKEYLNSLHASDRSDAFESYYDQRIGEIVQTFQVVRAVATDVQPRMEKPSLEVRVRTLSSSAVLIDADQTTNAQPDLTSLTSSLPISNTQFAQPTSQQPKQVIEAPIDGGVVIPQQPLVGVAPGTSDAVNSNPDQQQLGGFVAEDQVYVSGSGGLAAPAADGAAQFNQNLPFPAPPTQPNKPVGMVLGGNNELLSDAIVELVLQDGTVARAVKTNSLGQFYITTPLTNGVYSIVVEKPGYQFPVQQLSLEGELIPPLEIRGQQQLQA